MDNLCQSDMLINYIGKKGLYVNTITITIQISTEQFTILKEVPNVKFYFTADHNEYLVLNLNRKSD